MAAGLAAAAIGGAAASLLPRPKRRWVAPLAAALSVPAAVAGAGLPWPAPALIAAFAGGAWMLTCAARLESERAGAKTALIGALAAAAFIGAAAAPMAGAGLALLGLVGCAAAQRPVERGDDPLLSALEAGLLVAAGAGLAMAAWNAGRASLDPSPFGFVLAVAAAAAIAGLAAPFAPRATITLWPSVGLAALLTPALIAGLPGLTLQRVVPLAGSVDPRQMIAALGVLLVLPGGLIAGLSWPRASGSRAGSAPALVGLAAGAWIGVDAGPATWSWALWLAVAAGVVSLLRGGRFRRRVLGLAIVGAAVAARVMPMPWPEIDLLTGWTYQLRDTHAPDRAAHLQTQLRPLFGGWGPGGAVLIQRDEQDNLVLRLDGMPLEYNSRAADTERMVGHLAGALAAGGAQAMVLGDDLGLVTEGLLIQGFDQIDVVVPDVEALRALAAARPEINQTQLNPSVRHIRGSGDAALPQGPPQDAIVEVARSPWPDAHQGLPGSSQLKRRADKLSEGGVYLLVVPSLWMETAQVRGLIGDFLEHFPAAWVFLPPTGADQLILAGWTSERRIPWAEVQGVVQHASTQLADLQIRSPLDLADRALVDRAGMAALAGDERARLPWLRPVLHRLPRMNAPIFLEEVDTAAELFEVSDAIALRLEDRTVCNREFLELLSAASGGALDKVFEKGRSLSERSCGNRSVETVITSGLQRAREQINQARAEGPSSASWSRAIQELQGALLIAPRSPEALTLLGECYFAQANYGRARTQFEKALEEDEAWLEALHGLARIEVISKNFKAAESLYRRAAERHPDNWLAAYELGAFLFETRRPEEAERMFKRASALDRKQYLPHWALANVYISLEQHQQVIIQGEQAVALEENAHTYYVRGRGYQSVQQYEAAALDFNRSILKDNTYWLSWLGLCVNQGAQQLAREAAASAKQGLLMKPGNPQLQQCLNQAEANLAPAPEE